MKKTLFLHVGHYKTGSSALQQYCSQNAAALAEAGLLYPATARPVRNRTNHGHLSLSIARDHGFIPPPWYGEDIATDEAYENLYAEVDAAPQTRVLVSSEEFVQLALRKDADAALADLARRLDRYDVKIVLYVREPMSLLKSWFNQVNKGPAPTRSFPSFASAVNPMFLAQSGIWQNYASAFGKDNMITIAYGNGVQSHVAGFLAAAGVHDLPVPETSELVNEAQPLSALEARRIAKAGENRDRLTFSDIKDITRYRMRVKKLSDSFDKVMKQIGLPLRSNLSAINIFSHYASLLESLPANTPRNQQEADNLRDMALKIEATDMALAYELMRCAHSIRPSGAFINRKLAEYSDSFEIKTE
ncbi:hypothetical protein LCM17_06650 [Cereibacter sphaeroides]|nr:hypothetical protein [Cereibacter sphaeroides]